MMKKKLLSEDIKTRPNAIYFVTRCAPLFLVVTEFFTANICSVENKYQKSIFKFIISYVQKTLRFLLLYSYFFGSLPIKVIIYSHSYSAAGTEEFNDKSAVRFIVYFEYPFLAIFQPIGL